MPAYGHNGLRDSAEDSRVESSSTSPPGGEEEEGHRPVDFVWGTVRNQHTFLLRMSSDRSHDGRAGACSMPGGDVQGNRDWDTLDTSGSPLPHPTVSQLVERRDTAIERFVRM